MLLPIKSRPLRREELCWLLLFSLMCFIQKSLCQDDIGPSVTEETSTLLPNQIQNQSEALDVNAIESSNNVTTERSLVPINNTTEGGATVDDTTDGQEVVPSTLSPTQAITVVSVNNSNNSSLNSSDSSIPTQPSSLDPPIADESQNNNATEASSDQSIQSSTEVNTAAQEGKNLPQNITTIAPTQILPLNNTSSINTTSLGKSLEQDTIFDENNTNDTNIEHNNAVTVVGDGTDNIVEYEDTIEDKDSAVVQKSKAEGEEGIKELRRQMIIITSILGGVVVLTLILVLALALSISKMKAKFSNKHERYLASTPDTGAPISPSMRQNRQEIHAYDNSAFNSGGSSGHEMEERGVDSKAEVERLGYEMYNGKHENR